MKVVNFKPSDLSEGGLDSDKIKTLVLPRTRSYALLISICSSSALSLKYDRHVASYGI